MKKTALLIGVLLVYTLFAAGLVSAQTAPELDTALKHYYSGQYSKAVSVLKDYTSKRPDPYAYYLLGYSLYELNKFDEADDYFREAYLIDPGFTPPKLDREKMPPKKIKKRAVKPAPKKPEQPAEQKPAEPAGKGGQTPVAASSKEAGKAAQQPQTKAESKPQAAPPAPAKKEEPKKAAGK